MSITRREPSDEEHFAALREGVNEFNAHHFWEAHERWERVWLGATGERRTLLKGLIQLAAAYYHVERRNYRGAARLFERAFQLLGSIGPDGCGVDFTELLAMSRTHARAIAEAVDASTIVISLSDLPPLLSCSDE